MNVAETEKNPMIRANAISHLAKYYDAEIRSTLIKFLDVQSFGDDEAYAAIGAIEAATDETAVPVLIEAVRRHSADWETRTISSALESIGRLSSKLPNKDASRELLIDFTQSPRSAIKISAIRALGFTKDSQATAIIEPFRHDSDAELKKVAQDALNNLRDAKPLVPKS